MVSIGSTVSFSGNARDREREQSNFGPVTAAERAQRSVFVGNIPYEATEEQLKEIFCQVGPVVSFRLVYDRETGKPKGYGFCEYQDVETARSAMRNLNNHDFNGRPLRVGVAAGEQGKDDKTMQQALGGMPMESPYGDPVEPVKAPEAISKAVASLPPEQMFELMKQMKLCIQNNPNEARNMLLQNPQLAYALLQAQIVMKIVDPQVALAMLHRQTEQIPPLLPTDHDVKPGVPQDTDIRMMPNPMAGTPAGIVGQPGPAVSIAGAAEHIPVAAMPGVPVSVTAGPVTTVEGIPASVAPSAGQPISMAGLPMSLARQPVSAGLPVRSVAPVGTLADPRMASNVTSTELATNMSPRPDVGTAPVARSRGLLGDAPGVPAPPSGDVDFRDRGQALLDTPGIPGQSALSRSVPAGRVGPPSTRAGPPQEFVTSQTASAPEIGRVDPRNASRLDTRDPRQAEPRRAATQPAAPTPAQRLQAPPSSGGSNGPISSQDQEKTALIMQVLQLTDEQIAMLPPDQRQSIIILKDQIARSAV